MLLFGLKILWLRQMDSAYPIGQAVYTRTDTPDFEEEVVPFSNLEELVNVCVTPRDNCILEKVIIYAMPNGTPSAVTLGFISATTGERGSFDQNIFRA